MIHSRTLHALEFPQITEHLAGLCLSPAGRERVEYRFFDGVHSGMVLRSEMLHRTVLFPCLLYTSDAADEL